MDMIAGMEEELSRLLDERPALESERKRVFDIIDHAPHMTPVMREEVHALYNHRLANVQEDISGITERLKELGGGSGGPHE